MIAANAEVEKINHLAHSEAIYEIAYGAAEDQCQSDPGASLAQGRFIPDKEEQAERHDGEDQMKASSKERNAKSGIRIMDVREPKKTAQHLYGSP